ncbi:hypothetical protein PC116_g31189 [Phytophthora cactorum]|nr:hypothetical protein PC116_g31189 [Phytophthora cactorum]
MKGLIPDRRGRRDQSRPGDQVHEVFAWTTLVDRNQLDTVQGEVPAS